MNHYAWWNRYVGKQGENETGISLRVSILLYFRSTTPKSWI